MPHRKHASDFGDNPHIRKSHGEAKNVNVKEPWEVAYARSHAKVRTTRRKAKAAVKTVGKSVGVL